MSEPIQQSAAVRNEQSGLRVDQVAAELFAEFSRARLQAWIKSGELLVDLTAGQIDALFADGTISGGMLPKISGALDAAKSGVNAVHIIDGRVPHALLLEILTDQAFGTMIRSN